MSDSRDVYARAMMTVTDRQRRSIASYVEALEARVRELEAALAASDEPLTTDDAKYALRHAIREGEAFYARRARRLRAALDALT